MANEASFIVQRKYFHVRMKVLSFFLLFYYDLFTKTERQRL